MGRGHQRRQPLAAAQVPGAHGRRHAVFVVGWFGLHQQPLHRGVLASPASIALMMPSLKKLKANSKNVASRLNQRHRHCRQYAVDNAMRALDGGLVEAGVDGALHAHAATAAAAAAKKDLVFAPAGQESSWTDL